MPLTPGFREWYVDVIAQAYEDILAGDEDLQAIRQCSQAEGFDAGGLEEARIVVIELSNRLRAIKAGNEQ